MALADSGGGAGGPLPEPVPTPNGWMVTALETVERCHHYGRIVDFWFEMDKAPEDDFYYLGPEHKNLILAVMAAESACLPDQVSSADAVGLMQVIPRPWYPGVHSNNLNVYWGMYILDRSIMKGGCIRNGLAAYNCGFVKLRAGECGSKGGYHYADNVLGFWLPLFE